jgi:hypothetical protein
MPIKEILNDYTFYGSPALGTCLSGLFTIPPGNKQTLVFLPSVNYWHSSTVSVPSFSNLRWEITDGTPEYFTVHGYESKAWQWTEYDLMGYLTYKFYACTLDNPTPGEGRLWGTKNKTTDSYANGIAYLVGGAGASSTFVSEDLDEVSSISVASTLAHNGGAVFDRYIYNSPYPAQAQGSGGVAITAGGPGTVTKTRTWTGDANALQIGLFIEPRICVPLFPFGGI